MPQPSSASLPGKRRTSTRVCEISLQAAQRQRVLYPPSGLPCCSTQAVQATSVAGDVADDPCVALELLAPKRRAVRRRCDQDEPENVAEADGAAAQHADAAAHAPEPQPQVDAVGPPGSDPVTALYGPICDDMLELPRNHDVQPGGAEMEDAGDSDVESAHEAAPRPDDDDVAMAAHRTLHANRSQSLLVRFSSDVSTIRAIVGEFCGLS